MTIDEYISNFLRDAQYRIGVLSCEIDDLEDEGSYQYSELFRMRLELSTFMAVLYEGKWLIADAGYNHLQLGTTWTEREVIQEIEHLRYYTQMNEVPWINFTGHYPTLLNIGGGTSGSGGSVSFPSGLLNQILVYNIAGEVYSATFNPVQGHMDEPITTFFL